jgi:hypothetical protein
MEVDDAIRARGFRRWYERQLYESHAYLITGFLSLVMLAIVLEYVGFRESFAGLVLLLVTAACGAALCIFAWRRFTALLFRAEFLAGQAVCPRCKEYARFTVVDSRRAPESPVGCALRVRCRACSEEWTMR